MVFVDSYNDFFYNPLLWNIPMLFSRQAFFFIGGYFQGIN